MFEGFYGILPQFWFHVISDKLFALRLTYLLTYLLAYLLTYLLTPRSRVVLEKLNGFQLVKEFPTFYGTLRFITALTNTRHLSLSWASSIKLITPHPTPWISILILSSHQRLGLPGGLFPLGFPTKTLYTPLLSPIRATWSAHLIVPDFYLPKNIGWGVQIIKLPIM